MLLEVIACSVHDAIEAQRGGAGRLELVRELGRGGLTPPLDLIEEVIGKVTIPVRVMIREADGYAAGSAADIDRLARLAERAASLGADVVVGFLRGGQIDVAAMNEVLAASNTIRATFHRAFDDLPDPIEALAELRRWPVVDRVLTSGGPGTWHERAARLRQWSAASGPSIGLLPGGGIDGDAVAILADVGLAEAHSGRAVREPRTAEGAVSAQRVAELLGAAHR